jgi:hypothetical protein
MISTQNLVTPSEWIIPAGWKGGFAQSDPSFAYPDPDLSSLPMLGNLDNIKKLERQQKAIWPEFSWETEIGKPESRCFQKFSPDISRIGYDEYGRVYAIICPQQGMWIPGLGCLNIEVTVTSQRGWVDEKTRHLAADMTVEGQIWFSPSTYDKPIFQAMVELSKVFNLPLPLDKPNSIKVTLFNAEDPTKEILPVRYGETTLFTSPDFAILKEAWSVANVEVEIGPIKLTNTRVDEFNKLVMELFNLGSGNLLLPGNVLTWNVWVTAPELVDQVEWQQHADRWRKSIDEDHGSPDVPGTTPATIPKYIDGRPFSAFQNLIDDQVKKIMTWIYDHLK